MICGAALDGGDDDLSRSFLRLVLCLCLDLLDLNGHFVCNFVLEGVYHVRLGFLYRVAGNLLQHFELALLDKCDFLLLSLGSRNFMIQSLGLAFKCVGLSVEVFFLLLKSSLLLLQVGTTCLFFPLILRAVFVYFFLCFDESLTFLALGALNGFVDYPLCFFLGADYLPLRNLFAVGDAQHECARKSNNDQYNC